MSLKVETIGIPQSLS